MLPSRHHHQIFLGIIIENLPSLTTDIKYKISSHYHLYYREFLFSLQKNILSKLHSELVLVFTNQALPLSCERGYIALFLFILFGQALDLLVLVS